MRAYSSHIAMGFEQSRRATGLINEFNTNVHSCDCVVFVNSQEVDTAHRAQEHIDANFNNSWGYIARFCIFILYSSENTFINQAGMLGLCQILHNAYSIGNSHPALKLKLLTTAAFWC